MFHLYFIKIFYYLFMSNTVKVDRQHKALKGTRGGLNFYLNHNMENLYPDYSKKNLNIFI